jgi:ribosome-associated translation inhibitor RaiA
MQVQINTDRNIKGHEELTQKVEITLVRALDRFTDRITRLEVHLGDENSHKSGADDKRCMIEARLKRLQPIAATHQAPTIDLAVAGAAEKVKRALESTIGRLSNKRKAAAIKEPE